MAESTIIKPDSASFIFTFCMSLVRTNGITRNKQIERYTIVENCDIWRDVPITDPSRKGSIQWYRTILVFSNLVNSDLNSRPLSAFFLNLEIYCFGLPEEIRDID